MQYNKQLFIGALIYTENHVPSIESSVLGNTDLASSNNGCKSLYRAE